MTILEYLASRSESPEMPAELRGLLRPSTPADPAGWRSATERLLAIRGYPDDWDGEGSEAADPKLVDLAFKLVDKLQSLSFAPPYQVILGHDGEIAFVYCYEPVYAEVTVNADGQVMLRVIPRYPGRLVEVPFPYNLTPATL